MQGGVTNVILDLEYNTLKLNLELEGPDSKSCGTTVPS